MGTKEYPETSHISFDIRPCHKEKVLEHLFHRGKKVLDHASNFTCKQHLKRVHINPYPANVENMVSS